MSQFQVDHATLRVAANEVRSAHSNTQDNLKKLWDVVDDLAMAWKGSASGGFQQLMQRFNTDVSGLLRAMSDIADLLDKSADTHQTSDEEQAQAINKYGAALNG